MGAKTRLIYNNLWRKGTALPADPVADPQHPVSDTMMDTKSMYFQSSTLGHPLLLPMDLGGAKEVDFVAIIGHNFADIGAGLTIQFQLASNDVFGADLETIDLTYAADNMFKFFTAYTRQYVRLRVERAGDFTVAPKVGAILCGKYAEFNRRFAPDYEIGEEDFSEEEYGDSQVLFAQEKDTLNIRRYSYQALNTTSKDDILAMFKECKTIKAFAVCLDHTAANTNTLWVKNAELNSPVCRRGVWYWEMAIMEVK